MPEHSTDALFLFTFVFKQALIIKIKPDELIWFSLIFIIFVS